METKFGRHAIQYIRLHRQQVVVFSAVLVALVVVSTIATGIFESDHLQSPLAWTPSSVSHDTRKGVPTDTLTPAYPPAFTRVSVITDTEVKILQQVARELRCPSDISVHGATYSFSCMPATGHSINVGMERFTSPAEALAAFDMARGEKPLQYFRCYPSYSWQYDENHSTWLPMTHRIYSWQADRWLIYIGTFDDTGYRIAPPPLHVSDLICQAADGQDLFSVHLCEVIYLPYIVRH